MSCTCWLGRPASDDCPTHGLRADLKADVEWDVNNLAVLGLRYLLSIWALRVQRAEAERDEARRTPGATGEACPNAECSLPKGHPALCRDIAGVSVEPPPVIRAALAARLTEWAARDFCLAGAWGSPTGGEDISADLERAAALLAAPARPVLDRETLKEAALAAWYGVVRENRGWTSEKWAYAVADFILARLAAGKEEGNG